MDFKKVGKGLLIAVGAAALTYLAQTLPNVNFGVYTPLVVAGFSALINFGREYLKTLGYQQV